MERNAREGGVGDIPPPAEGRYETGNGKSRTSAAPDSPVFSQCSSHETARITVPFVSAYAQNARFRPTASRIVV